QAKLVEQAMDLWPDALTVVDPVMGDHGRMYRGLAPEMVPAMYTLCSRASLILPNTTEAALLLGDPMPGVTGEAELHTAQAQAQRLTRICPRVLITGVAAGRGIACVGADRATGESLVRTPMVPKSFHGTGDIFGAVLVGRLLQGNVLPAAAQAAAESGTPLLLVGGVHDWIAPLHRSSILAHLHALPQAQALLWAEPEHDGHADLLFGATRSEANPALMAQITRFLRPEKFDDMKKSC
ncbi:MAG: bifunctional hydroxymethylpyrimidine kinase/phosphomethylpyrimidine kinase, partial [Ruminococcus sp.]|nr:bifunctional hydroxymethylpyrimidine kinase/phosphomethylpyrimidine kinase [Ruminococcus sp.]